MQFKKAERTQAKMKIALIGPSGSGKTYSALLLAKGIGGRVAVVDTERGSASLYAGKPNMPDFDVVELQTFGVQDYINAIQEASALGYTVLILDSITHQWEVIKEEVDKLKLTMKNEFAPWGKLTPKHKKFIDSILRAPIHVICTMRAKTAYIMEKDERTGKTKPVKVGLEPDQRQNIEYEFTTIFNIDENHMATISKDRTELFSADFAEKLSPNVGMQIKAWLENAAPPPPIPPEPEKLKEDKPETEKTAANDLADIASGAWKPPPPSPDDETKVKMYPRTRGFIYVLLKQLGKTYDELKAKGTFKEMLGKDSMNDWTEANGQRVVEFLNNKIILKQKEEADKFRESKANQT